MIHDEICTYEVCKLAKEKGFSQHPNKNGKCRIYTLDKSKNSYVLCDWDVWISAPWASEVIAAPTQSLLQRWLREEKGIVIDVVLDWQYNIEVEEIRYQYRIGSKRRMTIEGVQTRGIVRDRYFDTYELALEDALKYALESLV